MNGLTGGSLRTEPGDERLRERDHVHAPGPETASGRGNDPEGSGRETRGSRRGFWSSAAAVTRQARLVLLGALLVLVPGMVLLLIDVVVPQYESSASFLSTSGNGQSMPGLLGLAAQYGVVPGGQGGESPEFYATLLRSAPVLSAVAHAAYVVPVDGAPAEMTLIDYLQPAEPPGVAEDRVLKQLETEILHTSVDPQTGVVRFSVTTRYPQLSAAMALQFLEELQEYHLTRRQSQARAERAFIEGRLAEVRRDLADVEGRLEVFLEQNREFRNSPQLQFQHDRLQREVARAQQMVTSLTQSLEEAKIEEVRNTPVISVIETPNVPALPRSDYIPRRVILLLVTAAVFGIAAGMAGDAYQRSKKADPAAFSAFRRNWEGLWGHERKSTAP